MIGRRPARPRVFISYRRDDAGDITGRIRDSLEQVFRKSEFFYDVDSLAAGDRLTESIGSALADVKLLLVVIGPNWATIQDDQGNQRLNMEGDYVRFEVETGLQREIELVPVLVNRATMPRAEQLPTSIQHLRDTAAVCVRRDPDYDRDMDDLCKVIRDKVPGIRASSSVNRRRFLHVGGPMLTLLLVGWLLNVIFSPPSRDQIVRTAADKILRHYTRPAEQESNPDFPVVETYRKDFLFNRYRLRQAAFLTVSDWRTDAAILHDAFQRLVDEQFFGDTPDFEAIVKSVGSQAQQLITERKKFLHQVKEQLLRGNGTTVALPKFAWAVSSFELNSNELAEPVEQFSGEAAVDRELKLIDQTNP